MPEQVQRWLRTHDTADFEIRGLIDEQIVLTVQRKLGDYQKNILLSLPPKKSTRGQIELGTVLYPPTGVHRFARFVRLTRRS